MVQGSHRKNRKNTRNQKKQTASYGRVDALFHVILFIYLLFFVQENVERFLNFIEESKIIRLKLP